MKFVFEGAVPRSLYQWVWMGASVGMDGQWVWMGASVGMDGSVGMGGQRSSGQFAE
jgi:hypothetical protein